MKLLESAIRQYKHKNDYIEALDYDETVKIVEMLLKTIKAQARLLIAYRIGDAPPEWVFSTIQKAREYEDIKI